MRAIPTGFDSSKLLEIDRQIAAIQRDDNVSIVLAIESGSRAWGFPSPDSDYDCRFIFVRRLNDYLSPWPKRDVIERPIVDDLDVSGWDLGKALKLMLKGNAVVLEWLRSPIVYDGSPELRTQLLDLAQNFASRTGIARHYLHLGERQRRTYFSDEKHVQLKKLFYALRPAVALRWLRMRPSETIPPMHFPALIAECDPPAEVKRISRELIQQKLQTRELGDAPLPSAIKEFVDSEFEIGHGWIPGRTGRLSKEAFADAERIFRNTVLSHDGNSG
jgi:predicted nucleotidyltransferase